ncbi:diacylglycerol O-acyltransferase tgs1-like [Homarus americanus]|uniref:Diacylglycerol O-acyltransferase tgs1-like n=1 Tax=Homarus americanus TaxID=6706 RepID=A0A8J5MSE1_HOMAM|nr:diacylglycerol O-acyltransferase tgs1-like [Homarus americanus]
MSSIVHPLEQRIYSWFIANISRPANGTIYPAQEPLQNGWLQGLGSADISFNLPLQDVSLGVLALLALQTGVHRSGKLFPSVTLLQGKWNLRAYDFIVINLLKTILGFALLLVSLPLALPVICVFWVASSVTKLIYTLEFGSSVTKAEGMDSVWGVESKESRPFITINLLLSGAPDLDKIYRHIRTNILDKSDEQGNYCYKKFRQIFSQTYGYYSWKDVEDFNIETHVRMINLRKFYSDLDSQNTYNESENTCHQSEDVHSSSPCDTANSGPGTRSMETDELVHRYNVIIRLHHAIGDGVSLVRLCVEALVDTPLSPPTVEPRPTNLFLRAVMMVCSALVLPLGLLQVVVNFDHNALHGHHLSGRKVMTASRGLPLLVLKQVKLAAQATVNDVLLSCLAASLSRHFSRRSEEVNQVTAVVPVSFHDLRAPLTLTNRFSVATVKLPSAQTHTPIARLAATKSLMDGMKRDPTLGSVFWVVRAVSEVLPAPVAQLLLSGRGVTVAASNVPGPQQEISVWGDKVEDMLFWIPNRAPVGVGVSFASYMGVVKVGLNVDTALVHSRDEAQKLLEDMEEELYRLHHRLVLARQE